MHRGIRTKPAQKPKKGSLPPKAKEQGGLQSDGLQEVEAASVLRFTEDGKCLSA